jgi:hypothetical protein
MAGTTSTGIDMQITPDYDSQIVGHGFVEFHNYLDFPFSHELLLDHPIMIQMKSKATIFFKNSFLL